MQASPGKREGVPIFSLINYPFQGEERGKEKRRAEISVGGSLSLGRGGRTQSPPLLLLTLYKQVKLDFGAQWMPSVGCGHQYQFRHLREDRTFSREKADSSGNSMFRVLPCFTVFSRLNLTAIVGEGCETLLLQVRRPS